MSRDEVLHPLPLSPGDIETLRALCTHPGAKAAAAALGIAPSTLKAHLTRVHARLGVSTTVECAYIAFRLGILV